MLVYAGFYFIMYKKLVEDDLNEKAERFTIAKCNF